MTVALFRTYYFDDAISHLPKVIDRAKADLRGIDFDTIVGTGFSGGIVIPALALVMDKQFLLIRKEGDNSHHRGHVVGQLGKRWIFVDDFISSGKTRTRVIQKVGEAMAGASLKTTMVGQYMYQNPFGDIGFEPFNPEWAER